MMTVVVTVTESVAVRPPLPVIVIVQTPAACGVMVSAPVVLAGAVATVTPAAAQPETVYPPLFDDCVTSTVCAYGAPVLRNDSDATLMVTAPGAAAGAAVGVAVADGLALGVGLGGGVEVVVGVGVTAGAPVGVGDAAGLPETAGDGVDEDLGLALAVGEGTGVAMGVGVGFAAGDACGDDEGLGAVPPTATVAAGAETAPPPPPLQAASKAIVESVRTGV